MTIEKSINKKISEIDWKPDLILASYHGIPKKYFDKGDPYHCYCHKTTRLINEKLNSIEIKTTFQSRFGPQEWLQPYTDKTLEELPKEGKRKNSNQLLAWAASIKQPFFIQNNDYFDVYSLNKKIADPQKQRCLA